MRSVGARGLVGALCRRRAPATQDNNNQLLAELAQRPGAARTARYRCVLALVRERTRSGIRWWRRAAGKDASASGAAGSGGFGYDPLFIPEGCECTAAELGAAHKNALSHRGAALRGSDRAPSDMGLSAPPLSLYVHFPWCVRKCPYCDFNSHTLSQELPPAADTWRRCWPTSRRSDRRRRRSARCSACSWAAAHRACSRRRPRAAAGADARATRRGRRGRDHTRGQSRHRRARPLRRLSRRRHQPGFAGRAELRCAALQRAGRIHSPQDTRVRPRSCRPPGSTISIST